MRTGKGPRHASALIMSVRMTRVTRELKLLREEPPPGVLAAAPLREDDVFCLRAHLQGPQETPYAGGVFEVEIDVPDRYPFEPPRVCFITPIFHPNIDGHGRICLDTLKPQPQGSWTPSINMSTLLTTIRLLMAQPNGEDGLMPEATNVYRRDPARFEELAREHTERFAMKTRLMPGDRPEPAVSTACQRKSSDPERRSADGLTSERTSCLKDTASNSGTTANRRQPAGGLYHSDVSDDDEIVLHGDRPIKRTKM